MTTRLYLVRHGATPQTMEDKFSGAEGVRLSEQGRQQVERLAERLQERRIAAAYASPLERTVATAEILIRPHGLKLTTVDGLREINHGHWEGLTRREVEQRYAEEYTTWEEDPFSFAPEGGESGLSVLSRALPAIREIVVRHKDQNVLVVSHKATLRLLLSSLLGFDPRGYRDRLDQAPACLNVVDFRDSIHARLMLFNDISHYAEQPLSAHGHLSKWWDVGDTANK